MATEQPQELGLALSQAERPLEAPRLPPASLNIRIKTARWLRRLLPTRLVVARAVRQGTNLWERYEDVREDARAAIAAILAGTTKAREIETLAREHVIEDVVHNTLFWQPWKTAKLEAASTARLRAAFSIERGVLLSRCHMGPSFQSASVGVALGRTVYVVAGAWCFEEPTSNYWGRRVARTLQGYRSIGARAFPAPGSFALIRALLERNEIVLIAFDVPGEHETDFLAKPVMLATGTARLAVQSDALIVPIRPRRVKHQLWVDVEEPLDPRDFASAEELHQALARIHERWIIDLPATLEDPHRAGFWEAGATTDSWVRP
jgi:lauroyl/myristoyl acyltransferase